MNQYTLRQIPENIYNQLRILAQNEHISINKAILLLIKKALGIENDTGKRRDLSDLAGAWDDKQREEFEDAAKPFEEIDPEVWKS
jgi:hypothetical protein